MKRRYHVCSNTAVVKDDNVLNLLLGNHYRVCIVVSYNIN